MIATGTLLVALSRIIKEVFVQFKKLNSYISNNNSIVNTYFFKFNIHGIHEYW